MVKYIPLDITALKPEQQTNMFMAWCKLVMAELPALGAKGVLQFDAMGDSGMAQERVMQGAQVWIEKDGKKLKFNQLVAFNDMTDDDIPNLSKPTIRRNYPSSRAAQLIETAQRMEADPPPAETYGLLVRPAAPDVEV